MIILNHIKLDMKSYNGAGDGGGDGDGNGDVKVKDEDDDEGLGVKIVTMIIFIIILIIILLLLLFLYFKKEAPPKTSEEGEVKEKEVNKEVMEPLLTKHPPELGYDPQGSYDEQYNSLYDIPPKTQIEQPQEQPTIQPQQIPSPTPQASNLTPNSETTQPISHLTPEQAVTQQLITPCPLCQQQIAEYTNPCPHCGGALEWGGRS